MLGKRGRYFKHTQNELTCVVFFSEMYSWRSTRLVPFHVETLYCTRTHKCCLSSSPNTSTNWKWSGLDQICPRLWNTHVCSFTHDLSKHEYLMILDELELAGTNIFGTSEDDGNYSLLWVVCDQLFQWLRMLNNWQNMALWWTNLQETYSAHFSIEFLMQRLNEWSFRSKIVKIHHHSL